MARLLSSSLTRMFIIALAVFVGSMYLGILLYQATGGGGGSESLIQQLSQVMAPIVQLSPPLIMLVIFLNNSIKALVVIVLGYALGIVPFVFLAINGLVVGVVVGAVSYTEGPWASLPALAPHGIIEVPALLLASALGFKVGGTVLRRIFGGDVHPGGELKSGLLVYVKVVLPALFIASIVETFVTPLVMGKGSL